MNTLKFEFINLFSLIRKHKLRTVLVFLVTYFSLQTVYYITYMKKVSAQTCFTQAMLDAERDQQKRCLYAYNGEVWDPSGGSFRLHKSQPCAEDVYCTIVNVHFVNDNIIDRIKDVSRYFRPSLYVGTICSGETIRKSAGSKTDTSSAICSGATSTPTPTRTPTPSPTRTPTPTATKTPTPTQGTTPTIQPTATSTPRPSNTPTISPTRTPTPTTPANHCQPSGDVDCSGKVNALDAAIVMMALGQPSSTNPAADINNSGTIDVEDLRIVTTAYGTQL
ncbi:hypothetical protein HGA91_00375 [candidate division WWE3 bacterium]|nr:hypothetical protein [candidate division WWE3 bacterium]